MNTLLKLEEICLFVLGSFAFHLTGLSWWWMLGLFFLPDIGMLGYLIHEKAGAWTYNLLHHRGLAIVLYFSGYFLESIPLTLAGIILFSHAAFDRIFGYGLKYEKGFHFTHLGNLKKPAQSQ
ncbi:DUF4260 domain-containing protein [Algoriphagus vanfongensis]|uniref:DUF4260 domain-containing protein n=1 Tax=Algoriphagus vanfongensis TaxID=426371 RepID=UPI0003FD444C|nr:DUF4260 domain-containing protein [Algoriphagus vanfongensis]